MSKVLFTLAVVAIFLAACVSAGGDHRQQHPPSPSNCSCECSPGRECCNDCRLGPVCFDPCKHTCIGGNTICRVDQEACNGRCFSPYDYKCHNEETLCALGTECCGRTCYDPDNYRCVREQLIRRYYDD